MFASRTNREERPASSAPMPPTDAKSMVTQHFYSRKQLATPITFLSDEGEEILTVFSVPRYPSDVSQRLKAEHPEAYQALVREQPARNRCSAACRSENSGNKPDSPIRCCRSSDKCRNWADQRGQESQFRTQSAPQSNPIRSQILGCEASEEPSKLDRQTPIADNKRTADSLACTIPAPECGDHPMTVPAQKS
jgi:hypothetical protein